MADVLTCLLPSDLFVLCSLCSLAGTDARADNVDGARHSITLVTSIWGNGEIGPLAIVLPNGFLSDKQRSELEEEYRRDNIYFLNSNRSSHFMTSETVVSYFEKVLADSFAKRRRTLSERYSRSFDEEYGLLLADAFSGHHSTLQGWDVQRALEWLTKLLGLQ